MRLSSDVHPAVVKDRPDATDPGFDQRFSQRHAQLVRFLDEVEQHNHVAHDDANEARDTENRAKHPQFRRQVLHAGNQW
jgi:hypothetical protein